MPSSSIVIVRDGSTGMSHLTEISLIGTCNTLLGRCIEQRSESKAILAAPIDEIRTLFRTCRSWEVVSNVIIRVLVYEPLIWRYG